jgi:hypothetical protein
LHLPEPGLYNRISGIPYASGIKPKTRIIEIVASKLDGIRDNEDITVFQGAYRRIPICM